jgi:hypothetical protein
MGKVVVKVKLTNYVEEQLKKLRLLKSWTLWLTPSARDSSPTPNMAASR